MREKNSTMDAPNRVLVYSAGQAARGPFVTVSIWANTKLRFVHLRPVTASRKRTEKGALLKGALLRKTKLSHSGHRLTQKKIIMGLALRKY